MRDHCEDLWSLPFLPGTIPCPDFSICRSSPARSASESFRERRLSGVHETSAPAHRVSRARAQTSCFKGRKASGTLRLTPVSLCSIASYMGMLILSIRLRAEQLQGLEKFAKERHLSVGWCIRAAVDEWLKKHVLHSDRGAPRWRSMFDGAARFFHGAFLRPARRSPRRFSGQTN